MSSELVLSLPLQTGEMESVKGRGGRGEEKRGGIFIERRQQQKASKAASVASRMISWGEGGKDRVNEKEGGGS